VDSDGRWDSCDGLDAVIQRSERRRRTSRNGLHSVDNGHVSFTGKFDVKVADWAQSPDELFPLSSRSFAWIQLHGLRLPTFVLTTWRPICSCKMSSALFLYLSLLGTCVLSANALSGFPDKIYGVKIGSWYVFIFLNSLILSNGHECA